MNKAKVFAAIFGVIVLGMAATILSELEESNVTIVDNVTTMVEGGIFVTNADAVVSATPIKQLASGVLPDDVKCKDGYVFVKKSNGSPACVMPTSIYQLFNRGWISKKIDPTHTFDNVALDVARGFVISSPTFAFDGILHTLDLEITQKRESFPEQFVIGATFDSRHGGFGDRTGQIVTQVITPHKMTLVVAGGKVITATIDQKWDELNQVLLGDAGSQVGPNYNWLVDNLKKSAVQVKQQGAIEQPFFSAPGRLVDVDGQTIQVFEYDSQDVAKAESSTISKDGITIGTSIATWVGPPHFYQKENLIVLYVGNNLETLNLLESILGKQIAGSDTVIREFSITYTKEGGIAGLYQKITFDSSDGMIIVEGHNAQTLGPVDSFALGLMLEMINDSSFFETSSDYPPAEGSADYFTYALDISAGNLENKVSWTDTSENVPEDVVAIAQEIEQFILDYQ